MCIIDKFNDEGIYKCTPTYSEPLTNYVVVKRYPTGLKKHGFWCLEDCYQQVLEWDEDFIRLHNNVTFKRGYKYLSKSPEIKNSDIHYTSCINRSIYDVYDDSSSDKAIFSGTSDQIAKLINCARSTVSNAAHIPNRLIHNKYAIKLVSSPFSLA